MVPLKAAIRNRSIGGADIEPHRKEDIVRIEIQVLTVLCLP